MRIYVPSSGRADRLITIRALPRDADVAYVVPGEEADDYRRALDAAGWPAVRLVRFGGRGIRAKRQFIVDLERETPRRVGDDAKILMLDDDLRFRQRASDGRYFPCDYADAMLDTIEKSLDDYAHVGISDEFMSNHNPPHPVESRRYNQVLGYDLDKWPEDVRFRLEVNEEHDVHLQLATRGLPPLVLTQWTKGSTFYARGGCSVWRTGEVELAAHRQLAENFPDLVKVVPHEKSLSGYAIRVQWGKAGR